MGQKESVLAMTKDILPIPSYSYVADAWVPKQPREGSHKVTDASPPPLLKIVTYNVWFESHYFSLRGQKLCEIMEKSDADVICLQEMTTKFLTELVACKWVKEGYVVSDVQGDTFHGFYGVMMLVKSYLQPKFCFRTFPTHMGRRALYADVHCPGISDALRVCTAHFESLNNADYRKVQFEIVFMDVASEAAHALVMGDFNMDPAWALEQQHIPASYVDAWVAAHGTDSPGCTMTATAEFAAWRPDRVLVRSPLLAVASCELLGTEDIGSGCTMCEATYGRPCTPSDHYGLLATVTVDAARAAQQQAAARIDHAAVVERAVAEARRLETDLQARHSEMKWAIQLPVNRRFSQGARAAAADRPSEPQGEAAAAVADEEPRKNTDDIQQ